MGERLLQCRYLSVDTIIGFLGGGGVCKKLEAVQISGMSAWELV